MGINLGRTPIFSLNGFESNRIKEITRQDKNLQFTGIPQVVMSIIDVSALSFDTFNKDIGKLTPEELNEFMPEVENMLSDPSYQKTILEIISDSIENYWKYKKLGSTWIETKKEAIENVSTYIEKAFDNVNLELSVYYNIIVFDSSIRTTPIRIGCITSDQIKACQSYLALFQLAIPTIKSKIEEDMKPNIESDNDKIENDMMLLKHLLKKYPNFQETADNV
jgi:hypothetical protein